MYNTYIFNTYIPYTLEAYKITRFSKDKKLRQKL